MMENGSLVLFFGIAAAVIAVGFAIAISTTRSVNRAVRRVAVRLGAFFEEGGLFDEPEVVFTLSGCQAWLRVCRRHRTAAPSIRVIVNVRNRISGTFSVAPVDFPLAFLRRYGPPYVNIGDPEFDRDYVVESVPPSVAARVFAPARRHQAIATVLRLKGYERPSIELDSDYLVVRVLQDDPDEELLMELVKTAEEVLEYLLDSAPLPGIKLEAVELSPGGECQVCGSRMEEPVIRCEVCRTPHHRECWQYMGRCTTYACKGRRFVA